MTQRVYIQPISFASSPQIEEGNAIRLAGSMVYASRFALIETRGTELNQRTLASAHEVESALAQLSTDVRKDGEEQWENLQRAHPPLKLGERMVALDQPQIMGILNVTPDSFSDGGEFLDDAEAGRAHAAQMLEAGAAIIDIGGESTRPGAQPTWEDDEKTRVLPAVEYCAGMGAAISVDTRRAGVLEEALALGAHMANDVSALRYDPRSSDIAAQAQCPVILMHTAGNGDNLHEEGDCANIVLDVFDTLRVLRDSAVEAGIRREHILIDPGIGFGKSVADNLALINALSLFHALGQPLVLGASRKRMIGALSNEAGVHERLGGSLALAIAGMNAGVHVLRVHDVGETVQARNVWRGLRDGAFTDFSLLTA